MNDLEQTLTDLNFYWIKLADNEYQLTESGINSLLKFLSHGLDEHQIKEAMDMAAAKIPQIERIEERWRYFCGICGTAIRQPSPAIIKIVREGENDNQ